MSRVAVITADTQIRIFLFMSPLIVDPVALALPRISRKSNESARRRHRRPVKIETVDKEQRGGTSQRLHARITSSERCDNDRRPCTRANAGFDRGREHRM